MTKVNGSSTCIKSRCLLLELADLAQTDLKSRTYWKLLMDHVQIPHADTAAFLLRLVPVHLLVLFLQNPNFMVFG